ncbi:Group XIIB secretory phospholipase A2-like protein [Liparis tanakae]|uniref:Group XIIB secretory phospholipase A2-like protein n=1 Tax=Liparis tanakae TaxID=230148 RepID=A0A4Z2HLG6_9TELE|nr:Group XIIB secretory phospholipase A2-like protein [Liparis tanakae]
MEAGDADHQDSDVLPNNPSADNPEVDVPVVDGATGDGATAKEPETDSDRPAVDPPAMEADDADHQDSDVLPNNPSDDNPNVDVPVVDGATGDGATADGATGDGATAEEPETDSDRPAVDPPAMEAGDAGLQDNDIRPIETNQLPEEPVEDEDDNSWGLNSIRNSFQSIHGYFGSLVELAGGQNGVCQYRCRYEQPARPRPGYQHPEPNGCSSSLVGFQLDLGIPAMTTCCNQHDMCYDTCGTNKYDCDSEFRLCLHGICGDLKKTCESVADALHGTVGTLGCRPYMNSQRAACVCEDEERDEL